VYVRFLQLANVQARQAVLTQLPTELPAERRLSLLLLRTAERAGSHHVQLAAATAVRYSVTSRVEFRLLLASLRQRRF